MIGWYALRACRSFMPTRRALWASSSPSCADAAPAQQTSAADPRSVETIVRTGRSILRPDPDTPSCVANIVVPPHVLATPAGFAQTLTPARYSNLDVVFLTASVRVFGGPLLLSVPFIHLYLDAIFSLWQPESLSQLKIVVPI